MSLYFEAIPPGLRSLNGLEYDPERPARHCRLCGTSFQPTLARTPDWLWDEEVKWAVEILLKEWASNHNRRRHTQKQHDDLAKSGRFLTPEAAEKLIPLGIYPVQDMVFSDEVSHAGLLAPRAPKDDVEGT